MDSEIEKMVARLKAEGLSPEREARILAEVNRPGVHGVPEDPGGGLAHGVYAFHDLVSLQSFAAMQGTASTNIRSIDELLERDNQREQDGFPRKVNVGRLIKPGRRGKEKVVIVPTTVEEMFLHDTAPAD